MKRFLLLFLVIILLSCFALPVLASGVEGTASTDSAAVPDTSTPELVTLQDLNDSLGVIQSQLWIILVVGLLGYIYKFFRLFF